MSESNAAVSEKPQRVMSIDALRGFDMFWISGGQPLFAGLIALVFGSVPPWLKYHLGHPLWTGFAAWDMIMPLFLFVVGASMPFAFEKRIESGKSGARMWLKIMRRFVLLWIFGMFVQGHLFAFLMAHLHMMLGGAAPADPVKLYFFSNTLQSIAIGYVVAAAALLYLPEMLHWVLIAALLVGYWLLMAFVPFPGHAAGTLEPYANLARYIDVTVLGQFKDGTTYTWILSSLGFAASVLFGVRAGRILMSDKPQRTRLLLLVGMGFGCLALGAVWGIFFPIIKHIWTSSMALWAAGWSFLLLALFYGVIDVLGYRRWAFGFVVIGANALITYMIAEPFNGVAVDFVVGLFHNSGLLIHFLAAVAVFSATWAALYFLYRKRWFLRI